MRVSPWKIRASLLVVIIAVLTLIVISSSDARPIDLQCAELESDRRQNITVAREGRGIHEQWLKFRTGPVPTAQREIWRLEAQLRAMPVEAWVESLQDWDRRWIGNYDRIITGLLLARYSCG